MVCGGIPDLFTGQLRGFQQEALEFIVSRRNVLLAMDMGLGKTATALAGIEGLAELGVVDGGLIVVPSALKYQWVREIRKFTDERPFVVDGPPQTRQFLYQYADRYRYTIVGYSSLLDDWKLVRGLRPDFIIIDEASQIKGATAKRSQKIKRLGLECDVRIALTGQPVENRPEEVFSIMEFVDDEILGDFEKFDRTFILRNKWNGRPVDIRNIDVLHKRLSTVMFRRTHADVADQLPAVIESVEPIEFDRPGAELYRYIAADLLDVLRKHAAVSKSDFNLGALYGKSDGNDPAARLKGEVMSRLLCLRMLCGNPRLLLESAHQFIDTEEGSGSRYAAKLLDDGKLDKLPGSPKLSANIDWVRDVLGANTQNRVVLFSFFKGNLRYLKEATKGITGSVIFNGDMNSRQKDDAHMEFINNPECRLFLSSDAGGYGVNLDNANFLRSFDLPWSSGARDQRNARIIRLSSEFPHVNLSYSIMAGSIEERQYGMLEQKSGIAAAIVDGKYDKKKKNFELTLKSLTEFLEQSEV